MRRLVDHGTPRLGDSASNYGSGADPRFLSLQRNGKRGSGVLLALLLVLVVVCSASAAQSYLPVIEPAPAFTLVSSEGEAVKSTAFNGRITLLTFIYTHCASVCPMVTERMGRVADSLKSAGLLGSPAQLVSISFDPKRDTPGWLSTYSRSLGADPRSWEFLTGTPEQLATLLRNYDFYARQQPNGDFDHVSRAYLIDAHARVRQIYSLEFLDVGAVLRDIESLIAEETPAAPVVTQHPAKPSAPTAQTGRDEAKG